MEALEKDVSKGNKVLKVQIPRGAHKQISPGGDLQQQVLNCLLCANVPQGE